MLVLRVGFDYDKAARLISCRTAAWSYNDQLRSRTRNITEGSRNDMKTCPVLTQPDVLMVDLFKSYTLKHEFWLCAIYHPRTS